MAEKKRTLRMIIAALHTGEEKPILEPECGTCNKAEAEILALLPKAKNETCDSKSTIIPDTSAGWNACLEAVRKALS